MRSFTAANGAEVKVENGKATSISGPAQELAEALIRETNGQFSNDEIYEDPDLSLAQYLSEEMAGGPVT